MVRHIIGDLVRDSKDFQVIGHGCNCFCTMGAGIAPQMKAKFPECFVVDCETEAGDASKLGTITYTKIQNEPVVVNLYTQYGFARQHGETALDYDALRSSLKMMKKQFSGKTFGLPWIGAGLAGGDWNRILKIIEEEMRGEYVTIVQWEGDVK